MHNRLVSDGKVLSTIRLTVAGVNSTEWFPAGLDPAGQNGRELQCWTEYPAVISITSDYKFTCVGAVQ